MEGKDILEKLVNMSRQNSFKEKPGDHPATKLLFTENTHSEASVETHRTNGQDQKIVSQILM